MATQPVPPADRERPAKPPPNSTALLLYVLGTMVMLGVLSTLVTGVTARTVSYSDFKQMVRADEVAAVVVSDARIRATLKKSEQPIAVIRVDDPALLADLDQHGVKVSGEIASNWWGSLLVWLLPMALLLFYCKRVMSPREREMVAAHEAGHAVVASMLPGVDPVHKISIVQRGYEALGHTLQLPAEDRYLRTRQELRHQLAVLLGGRAAEEIVFQEMSTGGHNDLQRATEIARAMVAEYGMSDAIGPVAASTRPRTPFLPVPGMETPEAIAEETAREIDLEVKHLMTEAHERAVQILRDHRTTLDAVVRLLLEREVVEGDEVRRLLAAETAPGLRLASA